MIKVLDRLCEAFAAVAGALFLFITGTICYSIVTRTLNWPTPIWVIQFNEYALLWMTFLASAWLLSKDKHISIQIVTSRLSSRKKRALRTVHDIMGLLLCATFCYFCALSTWEHYVRGIVDVQPVDVPKAYVLVIIPVGFLLLALQFVRRIVEDFRPSGDAGLKRP